MSSSINDGGPAFPGKQFKSIQYNGSPVIVQEEVATPGMSLRDHIAINWCPEDCIPDTVGMCAEVLGIPPEEYKALRDYPKVVAIIRYRFADAMLAARNHDATTAVNSAG